MKERNTKACLLKTFSHLSLYNLQFSKYHRVKKRFLNHLFSVLILSRISRSRISFDWLIRNSRQMTDTISRKTGRKNVGHWVADPFIISATVLMKQKVISMAWFFPFPELVLMTKILISSHSLAWKVKVSFVTLYRV